MNSLALSLVFAVVGLLTLVGGILLVTRRNHAWLGAISLFASWFLLCVMLPQSYFQASLGKFGGAWPICTAIVSFLYYLSGWILVGLGVLLAIAAGIAFSTWRNWDWWSARTAPLPAAPAAGAPAAPAPERQTISGVILSIAALIALGVGLWLGIERLEMPPKPALAELVEAANAIDACNGGSKYDAALHPFRITFAESQLGSKKTFWAERVRDIVKQAEGKELDCAKIKVHWVRFKSKDDQTITSVVVAFSTEEVPEWTSKGVEIPWNETPDATDAWAKNWASQLQLKLGAKTCKPPTTTTAVGSGGRPVPTFSGLPDPPAVFDIH